MPDAPKTPKDLLDRISAVTNKRARFVLDSIVKNGLVTTEQINQAGYDHPPRAAQDVRDLGFRLRTVKVKRADGRPIAGYMLDEGEIDPSKAGRRAVPKKQRDAIIHAAGDRCQICGATQNLQVDHRIPYEVAGEGTAGAEEPFQVLCGSCNRKKSWDCEHCKNRLEISDAAICRACYWADSSTYSHVAIQQQRRADVVWIGGEVKDFERLRQRAKRNGRGITDEIKNIVKQALRK